MKEFIARGHWLQSILETHHHRYDVAKDLLVEASNLAQETDSRLVQYAIQIQKAYVYLVSGSEAASRDALIYAQRIQKKLVDNNLPRKEERQAFLNGPNARQLAEIGQTLDQNSV